MPAKKFWAYVRMLPVITARESIARTNEMSLSFGSMSKTVAAQYVSNLQMAASLTAGEAERSKAAVRPSSPAQLAALSGGSTVVIMEG